MEDNIMVDYIVEEGDDYDYFDDGTSSDTDFNMEDNTMVDDIDVEMGDVHWVHFDLEFPSLQQTIHNTHDSDDDFFGCVKCRGVTSLMSDGPTTRSGSVCQGKKLISKESYCLWVLLVSRSNEDEDWMIKAFMAKSIAQKHVHSDYQNQYTILSDYVLELKICDIGTNVKIEGVLLQIAKVFPAAEYRFCLRHVYENMKLSYKDKELQDLVWMCGKATSILVFENEMEDLKKFNAEARQWLCKIPPKHWARSHFTGRALSDAVTNNLCEVFNSNIGKDRDKPIITCLEYIREYLMRRICNVQKEIDKLQGPLTPIATTLLEKVKKEAVEYRVIFSGNGIPCEHIVYDMFDKIDNREVCGEPEEWVHDCYKLHTWKEIYKYRLAPINGRNMWKKHHVHSH
ncbi:hypothetical protein LXL04_023907 [Taraxacum kok-saghyz]